MVAERTFKVLTVNGDGNKIIFQNLLYSIDLEDCKMLGRVKNIEETKQYPSLVHHTYRYILYLCKKYFQTYFSYVGIRKIKVRCFLLATAARSELGFQGLT